MTLVNVVALMSVIAFLLSCISLNNLDNIPFNKESLFNIVLTGGLIQLALGFANTFWA